jgi:hypothetical protein
VPRCNDELISVTQSDFCTIFLQVILGAGLIVDKEPLLGVQSKLVRHQERPRFRGPATCRKVRCFEPAKGRCGGTWIPQAESSKSESLLSYLLDARETGMHGSNLQLIILRCCVCRRWIALRVDPDEQPSTCVIVAAQLLRDPNYAQNATLQHKA